jgi:hypothetical protein
MPDGNNCIFYGHHLYLRPIQPGPTPFLLLASNGNECALVLTSHAPCYMEMNHLPIDWRECPLAADVRISIGDDLRSMGDET